MPGPLSTGHAFGLGHVQVERALARMLEQVGAGLGDDQGQRTGAGFVETKLKRQLLPGAARRRDVAGVHDREGELGIEGSDQRFHFTTAIAVPSPGRVSISNSSTRRFEPPRPRPRPPPVV